MQFISEDNASRQVGLTHAELKELDQNGMISGVEKNGHKFYSTREIYRIRAIQFLMKTKSLTVDQARQEVDGPK